MPYAIKINSWRAIRSEEDLLPGETFAETVPPELEGDREIVEHVFSKPIVTPALYAQDIFVSSRDIKNDPDEAFDEALLETQKENGQPKSLDLISRSLLKVVEQLRKEVKDLKKEIAALDKRLKDLKN